ncbi:MAG: penicillin-binding protein 2 [Phycisphaerales bacterium]|nr:penicillin-binding protein 2 [Planctomycetota bacterium]MBL6997463.1 penicillin-binding protein 2 [Phycisphaerales bacterium]
MRTTKSITNRITITAIFIAVLVGIMFGAALYKVVVLKVSPPSALVHATDPVISTSHTIATRGNIIDSRGRILAASRIGHTLFADPSLVEDPEKLALELGQKLGISPAFIEEKIRSRPSSKYVVLEPLLDHNQVETARTLQLRPIGIQERLVREYPHGDVGGSLIGFVGAEHSGLAGFENRYDNQLSGESGKFVRQRDIKRKTIWVSPDQYHPTNNGEDIQLSIDVVIQNIASSRLLEAIHHCNAGGGRIVVANPSTGEILAMADILNPRDGWTQQPSDPNREINPRLGRNRCVTDPYEPGSTFKPFVWSAATELGLAEVDEVLQTPSDKPYRTTFGRSIRDAHYYGPSTWKKVLVKSMNSGMAIVAERFSHEQLQNTIRSFGFGERTLAGLGGETSGIITSPSNWNDYTQTSVSMGHEIAVTPLQMVQGFCAFARDGTVPQLQLTPAQDGDISIVRNAISPKTAALTRQILGEVMTEGTGKLARSDMYLLFGKSGTAQLPRSDGKGYFEERYISSFIAGAPIDSPAIVVLCVIDDPDKSIAHYGGTVAGPVVRDVIESSLQYLGVTPSTEFLVQASVE